MREGAGSGIIHRGPAKKQYAGRRNTNAAPLIGATSIFPRYVRPFLAYWLLLGGRLLDGCMPPLDRPFNPAGAPEPVVVGCGGA
jgi:hypothetical protein